MIRTLLRYTIRTLFPSLTTRPRPLQGIGPYVGVFLTRTFFSSVRLGRPLLAGLLTWVGLVRWLRRERARDPRVVAYHKRVRPGRAVKLRYMDGRTLVREEIIEG